MKRKIASQIEKIIVNKCLALNKIICIIILFNLIIFFKTEVKAATYGKDYFGEEYSNGYIRNVKASDFIRKSSGISVKTGKQIYSSTYFQTQECYNSNNTSKSAYVDYSQAARYIDNSGNPIWLDMRAYVWTNNKNYSWALERNGFQLFNLYNGLQQTYMELHFYTTGYCGDSNYEQSFKGVTRFNDLDPREGIMIYSGYNQFYLQSGIPITYIAKGSKNSTSGNNPFSTSGTASYPYFFGTRENNSTDGVWIEINSTPSSPFRIAYGTRNQNRGMAMHYQGTAIEYYVDGVLKDRAYCVPYGRYKLIDTTKLDAQKYGYNIDGWYTDTSYTTKANDGIAGTNTIRVYGKYIRYTITVDNERDGHTYNSYQVFKGSYYEKEGNNGEKIPSLLNIEWSEELQKEIVTENEQDKGKTHGDKIIEILKSKNPDLYKDCQTAQDIAEILQGKPNDGEVIREFTDIVGKYILDNNIPITKGTSTVVEEKDKNGNILSNYKIKDLDPGYYIVIDAKANEKDDAYSRYLIDVVQDVTMYPKTSIPRLNKKVIGNNIKTKIDGTGTSIENPAQYVEDEKRNTATYKKKSENYNAEDYDIEFELKSYIPDITGYNTYKFEVIDILAKGFDYDINSLKVMLGENEYPKTREKIIKVEKKEGTPESANIENPEEVMPNVENTEEIVNPEDAQENREQIIQNSESEKEIVENYTIRDVVINEENYETYKKYFEEEGKTYPEGYAELNYGKTLILIELKDLVEQVKEGIVEKGQDIFIRYNAKLNGKGEVGTTPNINEAYIKYSNDPYHNDKESQTTTQTTYTYTIDLNLSKIAEIKKSVENNNNTVNENLVEDSQISEKIKYLEGAEFEIYNGPEYIKEEGSILQIKNPNRKLIGIINTDKIVDSEENIIKNVGRALYSSLGAGTYYIKETKSPEGYNKLGEEIVIEISAICDEYGTITWSVEDKTNSNLVFIQMGVKDGTLIPEVKLQVENTSGFDLPVTGGIGTLIFKVVGISIILFVLVCFKEKNRK